MFPRVKNMLARAFIPLLTLLAVLHCSGEIFSAVGYSVTDTQDILTGRVSFVPTGEIRGIGG